MDKRGTLIPVFEKPGYYDIIYNRNSTRLNKSNNWVVMVRGNHDDPAYFNETSLNEKSREKTWVVMSRSKTPPAGVLPYIDVVEEALCFGWIDSTLKRLPDGRLAQRLSPRRKNSHWTKLNMDRCIDLEDRDCTKIGI